ncbi:hypothetical protein Tco_0862479 [Tanacetum coccineum]
MDHSSARPALAVMFSSFSFFLISKCSSVVAGDGRTHVYTPYLLVTRFCVPHPLSGDYTPREQEDIDDSLYEYGKYGPQPQSPSLTVSDASSIVFSICPSNDSDGELGAVSDHTVNDDPIHDHIPIPSIEQVTIATQKTQPQVPKPKQTVDPSCAQHVKTPRQPIRTPVISSPIPSNNRQNWNQQDFIIARFKLVVKSNFKKRNRP